MEENENQGKSLKDMVGDHLAMSEYCINMAEDALAEKGNPAVSNAASLIGIAHCLVAIGIDILRKEEGEEE